MEHDAPHRIDRRQAVKWLLTATAALTFARMPSFGAENVVIQQGTKGYGTDPDLLKTYNPGDLWPLTFTDEQRKTVAALCDTILPADADSPSASAVGVHDFIDEWVSAPYAGHAETRKVILDGLSWLDAESQKRFRRTFAKINQRLRDTICNDICKLPNGPSEFAEAAKFFKTFRDLTAGGYYTTPEGMKAVGYIGNVPLPAFEGPPQELIEKLGLA